MGYEALENILSKTDGSIYKLVVLASKRALEISEGKPKLVTNLDPGLKPAAVALHEIAEGRIGFSLGEGV
jgi:DNA-directed RNA polymerase omega subunit